MTRSSPVADSAAPSPDTMWPRSTTLFLVLVGIVLAVFSFLVVLNMPALPWVAADDARLRDALAAYDVTGAIPPWTWTTHSAGVGSVLVAILFGASADSPYAALGVAQAVAVALPLLWLPLCVARIFRRARAGYSLVLLPPLIWLLNSGTILVGTEYGLSDGTAPLRVPSLFGLAASLTFLGLSALVLLSTFPLRLSHRLIATVGAGVYAGLLALFDWYAAVAVAVAVSALWWRRAPRRTRPVRTLCGALAAVVVGAAVYLGVWGLLWGFPAMGLSSAFSIGDGVATEPFEVYFHRALFVIKHFGAMISFIVVGFVLALTRRAPQRRALAGASWVLLPSLILGFLAATESTPTLYTFAQLSATLGVLTAVALGALIWSITSMPSHVRSLERTRLSGRRRNEGVALSPVVPATGLSVVVPTRNGEDVLEETLTALGERLSSDDEIIVVENGSTDGTTALVTRIKDGWTRPSTIIITHSDPGLGEALRKGVETSIGARLLLTADDLPFGFTDLDEFERLPADVAVAIGSKAHPRSEVTRSRARTIQSRIFRFLRAALLQSRVGDSQGTLWVDGVWGREFAHLSRESGLMWTTELVLAAEQQGIAVGEVPVRLSTRHETGASRFRLSDAWQSFVGFTRLAVYKDDYCNEDWVPTTRAARDDEELAVP